MPSYAPPFFVLANLSDAIWQGGAGKCTMRVNAYLMKAAFTDLLERDLEVLQIEKDTNSASVISFVR